MCMFSGPVELVADTKIFARVARVARNGDVARQLLAYEMNVRAAQPIAMVLPVPTTPGGDLSFLDLSRASDFFIRIDTSLEDSRDGGSLGEGDDGALAVVRVGSFEATWVPHRAAFARLDKRFQLDDRVWRALPVYADWSFAVFQLAPGETHTHPMGFSFATRAPDRLFFPTVHVHDGRVPSTARFDHALYCQGQPDEDGWERTYPRAKDVFRELLDDEAVRALVNPGAHVRRIEVRGEHANEDRWVPLWRSANVE